MSESKEIRVAIGALCEGINVLLTRRSQSSHQGGLWEFPGGKIEPDETPEQALRREFDEELGIAIGEIQPLIRLSHNYTDRKVVLLLYRIRGYQGTPVSRDRLPMEWAGINDLQNRTMPEANRPLINALQLPAHYTITPEQHSSTRELLSSLETTLTAGERMIQLRLPGISADRYQAIAREALVASKRHSAKILLNAPPEIALQLNAHGVHLSSRRLMMLESRPLPANKLVGASCHNIEQLTKAAKLPCDFALLSPVLQTKTHPEATAIGWQNFRQWTLDLPIPVYALGGMQSAHLQTAINHGAQGIAAIRGLWRTS